MGQLFSEGFKLSMPPEWKLQREGLSGSLPFPQVRDSTWHKALLGTYLLRLS